MADLSVAHRAALAQLVETVPDRILRRLARAVGAMPGDRARALEAMLAETTLDRARRAKAMAALAPMFQPRPDGVDATSFPPQVLTRLWRIAADGQAPLLASLDPRPDGEGEGDGLRVGTVCSRLYATAAAAVRDRADVVWPMALGDPAGREKDLEALAQACDLGGLAQRALPLLSDWVGRPRPDQVTELRLFLRDASVICADGGREFLEIMFAHMADASLILRLVANSSQAAEREGFLVRSELATFVNRLIDAADMRTARIARHKTGDPVEPLRADLEWISDLLTELDATLSISAGTEWGRRLRGIRRGVADALGGLLARAGKAVDRMLPTEKVQTAGRMTRDIPGLGVPVVPETLAEARAALDIVRITRGLTRHFGCEGQRQTLVADLTAQLISYADNALEEINAGVLADEGLACSRVRLVADFLERIEARPDARAVRRRVAVAGVPAYAVSPRAA